MPRPERFVMLHDDYHAEYVGQAADGRSFFLTTPFDGDEFLALYLFDPEGRLDEARIEAFGRRETMDSAARRALRDDWLADIGPVTYGRIEIAPFSVTRFGREFGMVASEFEGHWSVCVEPGDYMAYFEPWDSGDYDT